MMSLYCSPANVNAVLLLVKVLQFGGSCRSKKVNFSLGDSTQQMHCVKCSTEKREKTNKQKNPHRPKLRFVGDSLHQ